jgi:hypothetical protein
VVVRRLLSFAFALVLFAVASAVALGDPPPKGPVDPGFTVAGSL